MHPLRALVAFSTLALLAGSCQISTFTFLAPTSVAAGTEFTIEVEGTVATYGVSGAGPLVAVFQLPSAMQMIGANATSRHGSPPVTTLYSFGSNSSDPIALSYYVAQAGHYLVSFQGSQSFSPAPSYQVHLKVYLRSPSTAGVHEIKVAFGNRDIVTHHQSSPYYATLPGGGYSTGGPFGYAPIVPFSTVPPAHVRTVQVLTAPAPPPFVLAGGDLWNPLLAMPANLALGDIDSDGADDVVEQLTTGVLRAYSRKPSGWIALTGNLAAAPVGAGIRVGDFDGDQRADIVTASGATFFFNGGTSWTTGPVLPHAMQNAEVAVGDVDADGSADVVFANETGCAVFRGNANRTFTPFGNGLPASTSATAGRVQLADLDGDDVVEILTWSAAASPRLWRSDGQGNWFSVPGLPFAAGPEEFIVLDVDDNGTIDIVRSGSLVSASYAALAVSTVTIAPRTFDRAVALDVNRDGRLDIVSSRVLATPALMDLSLNAGSGVFQTTPLGFENGFRVLDRAMSLLSGDIDGDTFPDLVAHLSGERPLVWRNTNTGAASFGIACAAPGFAAPQLSVQGTVAPGQSPLLRLTGAQPNGAACFWAGLDKRTLGGQPVLPLDLGFLGAPGCTQYTEALVLVCVVADATGTASIPIPLPTLPPTSSSTIFAQGGVLAPGANALQGLFSHGLALKAQ